MWSESKLVKSAQSGDEAAFDTLIKQCGEQIYNLALRLTGNSADAEDLWQNAFIKAYKSISNFKQNCSFATWIYRITVNLWKDKGRYEKARGFLRVLSLDKIAETEDSTFNKEIPDPNPDPVSEIEQSQEKQLVWKVLDELDVKTKTMIILRDIENRSYQEISELLERPLGTVKWQIANARKTLRQKFLECLGENKSGL